VHGRNGSPCRVVGESKGIGAGDGDNVVVGWKSVAIEGQQGCFW